MRRGSRAPHLGESASLLCAPVTECVPVCTCTRRCTIARLMHCAQVRFALAQPGGGEGAAADGVFILLVAPAQVALSWNCWSRRCWQAVARAAREWALGLSGQCIPYGQADHRNRGGQLAGPGLPSGAEGGVGSSQPLHALHGPWHGVNCWWAWCPGGTAPARGLRHEGSLIHQPERPPPRSGAGGDSTRAQGAGPPRPSDHD